MIQDLNYHRFVCDECGEIGKEAEYIDGEKFAAERSLTQSATAEGWDIDAERDLCPTCVERITKEENEDKNAEDENVEDEKEDTP